MNATLRTAMDQDDFQPTTAELVLLKAASDAAKTPPSERITSQERAMIMIMMASDMAGGLERQVARRLAGRWQCVPCGKYGGRLP